MTVYEKLERVFHEPSRLAILTALCSTSDGLSFGELKEECKLTDGNLSRHLAALEKESVVKIKKSFVENRPRTTVLLTSRGKESFLEYLAALEAVLKETAGKVAKAEVLERSSKGLKGTAAQKA